MHRATALITGASDGLGKFFALELAQRNSNLVLVALPCSGLNELCCFLKRNFGVNVYCFEIDLSHTENCEQLFQFLRKELIQITILINNAGIGNWSWFHEKETAFYKKQIELNTIAPVLLTRLFLEQPDKLSKSYILNVGSLGGLFIVPQKQVYGATKSFIRYFSKALQLELSATNVSVSLLSPGGINTKPELLVLNHSLKGISKASILEPEYVAKVAIDGLFKGKKEIIPGKINKVLLTLNYILPAYIKKLIIKKKIRVITKKHIMKKSSAF